MSARRRGRQRGKAKAADPAGRPAELWRPVPQAPEPGTIAASDDPAAVLRSLGDPPLPGQGAVAGHYLAAVVDRAAGLATAIGGAAGLLDDGRDDEDDEDDEAGAAPYDGGRAGDPQG